MPRPVSRPEGFALRFVMAVGLVALAAWTGSAEDKKKDEKAMFDPAALVLLACALLAALGLRDLRQSHHAILRNYPIIGHLRFLLE